MVADDSLVVREGVVSLLRRAGFDVVAQASSGDELVREVDAHVPDVALVDVRMPPTLTEEGLQAASDRVLRSGAALVGPRVLRVSVLLRGCLLRR